MCWSRSQAEAALERLTALLADLGLEPKAAKTRIVHLEDGGEGFDFLGFHHRLVRSRGLNGKKPVTFLARWPELPRVFRTGISQLIHAAACPFRNSSMTSCGVRYPSPEWRRARDRIRELTCRSRLLLDPKWIVEDLNRFLGGWAAYFRFGNSARRFGKIRRYAQMRLALFIAKRNRRSREFGWSVVAFQSPDQLGLTALSGIVVDPRPFRDWRGRPNAGGERRR
jgi:RNA-directed DNA polymerase